MPYASQTDLENALGVSVVKAIFDDNLDGVVDDAPMAACLAYGDAEVDSFLSGQYEGPFPLSPVPDAVKYAALDWCCAYAARRRPDLTRAMSEEPWSAFQKAAVEKMNRFLKAMQRLPATAGLPANVGATVSTSATGSAVTTSTAARVFDDMGDF